jgi:hypothetical protein
VTTPLVYIDTTAVNNTTYEYRVAAANLGSQSGYCLPVTVPTMQAGIDAQIKLASETSYTGVDLYAGETTADAQQTKAQTTLPTVAAVYQVRIKNNTSATTDVKLTGKVLGAAGNGVWIIKYYTPATSTTPESELSDSDTTDSVWTKTVTIAADSTTELLLKVTPGINVPLTSPDNLKQVQITAASLSQPQQFDVVKTNTTRISALDSIKFTVTQGDTWGVGTGPTASVPVAFEGSTIGFKAIIQPGVTLPENEPIWVIDGKTYHGKTVYVQVPDFPGSGSVSVSMGETLSMTYASKALPGRLHMYSEDNAIIAGGTGNKSRTTLTAVVTTRAGAPLANASVRFSTSLGSISSLLGVAGDTFTTDADGYVNALLSSGSTSGTAQVQALLLDASGVVVNDSNQATVTVHTPQP